MLKKLSEVWLDADGNVTDEAHGVRGELTFEMPDGSVSRAYVEPTDTMDTPGAEEAQ